MPSCNTATSQADGTVAVSDPLFLPFQAAFILQNLLVMPMPADAEEAKDSQWQVSDWTMARSKVAMSMQVFFSCI